MIKFLAEIADIQSGYHFLESVRPDAGSPFRVIQAKDISASGEILRPTLPAYLPREPQPGHFVHKNDILFISRLNPRAALVRSEIKNAIATSHFFIIRLRDDSMRPEYLSWYLNQKSTQNILRKVAQGTSIVNVTKRDLQALAIAIPPLEVQDKIAILYCLSREYQAKHDQLQHALDKLIQTVTKQVLHKAEQGNRE